MMAINLYVNMSVINTMLSNKISLTSNLKKVDGSASNLELAVVGDTMPIAIVFFDIDKTLAHLDLLYEQAIHELFPNVNKEELIKTFLAGFKLGNSFREFDRMCGIYIDGHADWKDPELYLRERLMVAKEIIDTKGTAAHERAANFLAKYGIIAASIADELYKKNPEVFQNAKIGPLYVLMEIYRMNGVMMFGFTANAKVFVETLSKYLGLCDYFVDIATDETMEGGGKEIAIKKLLEIVESKNLLVPKEQLVFIGDSIRGDIGSGLAFCKNNPGYKGHGIVVLEDVKALIEMRHLVNYDQYVQSIVSSMPIYGFVVSDVPVDSQGKPSLLDRNMSKFFFKL